MLSLGTIIVKLINLLKSYFPVAVSLDHLASSWDAAASREKNASAAPRWMRAQKGGDYHMQSPFHLLKFS